MVWTLGDSDTLALRPLPQPTCTGTGSAISYSCYYFLCLEFSILLFASLQVVGRKYVRLYSPTCNPFMYPAMGGLTTNSSQIDLEADCFQLPEVEVHNNTNYPSFPGFSDLPFIDCILQPGQMLYIPPSWWHFVKSLSSSFSVSFWWKWLLIIYGYWACGHDSWLVPKNTNGRMTPTNRW